MSFCRWILPLRHVCVCAAAFAFAACSASAQFAASPNPSGSPASSPGESSSLQLVAEDGLAALPSAPGPASAAAGQNGGGYQSHSIWHHLAYEIGGGFNAPAGSKDYITWGGNFTGGVGYRFNPKISVLMEYQFIGDKIPGKLIAEAGATGGHAHIWSLTAAPVLDLFPKSSNDVYLTGGGGFYRKVTSFTDPTQAQYCYYYYCGITTVNQVVGHFSSNQGGWNIGGGYMHRFGGDMYGGDTGTMAFFAEVRYLDVLTPAVVGLTPNGLGATTVAAGTKLIPVTVGVRW
jgi:hypothetical protein